MPEYLKTINGANNMPFPVKTSIEKARERQGQMVKEGKFTIENNLIKKANKNPQSKVKAIAAFCFSCFGCTEGEMPDPNWKNFIRECTAPECPLYIHRPYKQRTRRNHEQPRVRQAKPTNMSSGWGTFRT